MNGLSNVIRIFGRLIIVIGSPLTVKHYYHNLLQALSFEHQECFATPRDANVRLAWGKPRSDACCRLSTA